MNTRYSICQPEETDGRGTGRFCTLFSDDASRSKGTPILAQRALLLRGIEEVQ